MLFTFSQPQYLFLLIVIQFFFIIHFLSLRSKKKNALKFANFDAISKIEGIDFYSKNLVMLILDSLIVLLLIFAISGLTYHTTKNSSFFSFVLAIDSSHSMLADDIPPNRINASKNTAIEFVESVPSGVKVGAVSFSGTSYIEQDLTTNKEELKWAISNIGISGFGGTDIFEAIVSAGNLMNNEESKAVILLSDGQINVGDVDDIIDYANKNDIIIHSIAMGTKEGGSTQFSISRLDEESLKSLSFNTGGNYFDVVDEESLEDSFKEILNLSKGKVEISLFSYLILFSIILMLLKFFLNNTKYIHLP